MSISVCFKVDVVVMVALCQIPINPLTGMRIVLMKSLPECLARPASLPEKRFGSTQVRGNVIRYFVSLAIASVTGVCKPYYIKTPHTFTFYAIAGCNH